MTITAQMLSNLESVGPRVVVVYEFDFPTGTKRVAKFDVLSRTNGLYEGMVVQAGNYLDGLSDDDGNVVVPEYKLVIADDDDRTIFKAVGAKERLEGSVYRCYLAADSAFADWIKIGSGRVAHVEKSELDRWSLTLRPPDDRLNSELPIERFDATDFPDADSALFEKTIPWCLGNISSRGALTATGAVPCYLVSSDGMQWIVCAWWAYSVPGVYVNGALQTVNFSIKKKLINGRRYTMVEFTTDKSGQTVTADVVGIEDVGDGTGVPLLDPVSQMRFLIDNLLMREPPWGQNWYSGASPFIDSASWDSVASALSTRNNGGQYQGGIYMGERQTGYSILASWCVSHGVRVYWTPDGKLGASVTPLNEEDPVADTDWLSYPESIEDVRLGMSEDVVTEIRTSYLGQPAPNKPLFNLFVSEPVAVTPVTEELSLPYGPSVR